MPGILYNSGRTIDIGLLVFRIGIGIMLFLHGYPKIIGGPELWENIGSSAGFIGIDFAPAFLGLMAGIAEALGGILIFFGLFTRPACLFIMGVMVVAVAKKVSTDAGFPGLSHPLEMGITMLALLITGPGTYSLDNRFFGGK